MSRRSKHGYSSKEEEYAHMTASCMLLITLPLAVSSLGFGVTHIYSNETVSGILFTLFGFMLLISFIGLYKRNRNAHGSVKFVYLAFTLYAAVYLILTSFDERIFILTVTAAICLMLSFTKQVTGWNSLD